MFTAGIPLRQANVLIGRKADIRDPEIIACERGATRLGGLLLLGLSDLLQAPFPALAQIALLFEPTVIKLRNLVVDAFNAFAALFVVSGCALIRRA